jgi:signal transduction histidine kinase
LIAVANAGLAETPQAIVVSAALDDYVAGKGLFWFEFGPAALLMTIMAAALWIGASRLLFTPLDQLLLTIDAFGRGDLEARAVTSGARELNRLGRVFNQMAESLNRRQHALEASNAELENFAYVASHDLKAPLRAIDNLASWIAEDLPDTVQGEVHEHLELMRARVGRMQSLLDDLLQFSRAGRKNGDLGPVQTGLLVHDQFELLGPPEGFVLQVGDLPELRSFATPLATVFRNLLSNAVKHHDRATGRITVSATPRGRMVEFRVADDGPGIPAEYHGRVFGLFQTLKPRDEVEGSGMGLALVKKLVEARGGRIRLASTPPARGATFSFTWPLDEGQGSP